MTRFLQIPLLLTAVMLFSGCMFINIPLTFPPGTYQEIPFRGKESSRKILILDIDGAITSGATEENPFLPRGDSMVNQVISKLDKARADKNIKAVVLRIDSPGGGVTASDVIYRELKNFKDETGIPVYAGMLDMATSGGYYIAMAADHIYAHPTTVTGSIGVIALFPQFEDLGRKIGVYFEVIKSGDNKDMTGGFKNMSAEQRAIMQQTIDELQSRFVDVVAEGRPELPRETIARLADGRIYTAEQATELGLIDGIMYMEDLIDLVKANEGLKNPTVVFYRKSNRETIDSFYAKSTAHLSDELPAVAPMASLINIDGRGLGSLHRPVFQYLWLPY